MAGSQPSRAATLNLWADAATSASLAPAELCLKAWPPSMGLLASGWAGLVDEFQRSPAGQRVAAHLKQRLHDGAVIYPPSPFRALELTALDDVRVVILGQDPYHGPGQAEGLAFSVPHGVRLPPSLRNIFQELVREQGGVMPADGSLMGWAAQGVLLLNTCLTVEQGAPASHSRLGWEALSDALISACSAQGRPKAFLLWGAHAQAKAALIDASRHLILQANHPSPLSARRPPLPFIGCGHFGRVDDWLKSFGENPVQWLKSQKSGA